MATEPNLPILEMEGVSKRFPGVVALDNVSLSVGAGEIVALIGENGAGKSTLMKILGGAISRDNGTIKINGAPVEIRSPREASALGIEFIHQELSVLDNLDIAVRRSETLGIVGESGSGKTTFGQALLRLIPCQSGEISFDGARIDGLDRKALRPFRSRMQIVFQDPFSSLNPRQSIRGILEEGLIVNGIGSGARDRQVRIKAALVDLPVPVEPTSAKCLPSIASTYSAARMSLVG